MSRVGIAVQSVCCGSCLGMHFSDLAGANAVVWTRTQLESCYISFQYFLQGWIVQRFMLETNSLMNFI